MLEKRDWVKKFSLGLVLDTTLDDFHDFLDEFHTYIDNFYFSLPMGDRFHSRSRVVEQFHDEQIVQQFWKQLQDIREHGIKLEVLFNTGGTTIDDLRAAKKLMDDHGIDPEKVGFIDEIYDAVAEIFPGKEYVYSFNNRPQSPRAFQSTGHAYHEYVLGRQFIRNIPLMNTIHEDLKGRVVLLANNGCSHVCGGCSTYQHCFTAYRKSRQHYSAEYLYALQSVLPWEFHEGLLDLQKVDCVKLNTRNTNIKYLWDCIQSYIDGEEEKWLQRSDKNWSLWASLTWHTTSFAQFDLKRIKELKTEIYNGNGRKNPGNQAGTSIWLDLTDRLIFEERDRNLVEQDLKRYSREVSDKYGGTVTAVCIGVRSCRHLLGHIDNRALCTLAELITKEKYQLYFLLPPLMPENTREFEHLVAASGLIDVLDGIIADDMETYRYLSERLSVPVMKGPKLAQSPGGDDKIAVYEVPEHRTDKTDIAAGRTAVFQYPEMTVCRGICTIKRIANAKGRCETPACLSIMGRRFYGDVPEMLNLVHRGDLLFTSMENHTERLRMISGDRATLLLTPEFEKVEMDRA